ncbi:hypothetical protein VSDG_01598 [Cytospora chrysosperma]|uniref:Uncharacterized protein n=1 Tax=Cytospora chrysosperma TaxID=252740 RepID=A0A423WHH6_CYTCH|nr:hypothetical protein VSDG_01598 [Valsa sordida]
MSSSSNTDTYKNRESPSKTKPARSHYRAGAKLMNGASRLRSGGSRHRAVNTLSPGFACALPSRKEHDDSDTNHNGAMRLRGLRDDHIQKSPESTHDTILRRFQV